MTDLDDVEAAVELFPFPSASKRFSAAILAASRASNGSTGPSLPVSSRSVLPSPGSLPFSMSFSFEPAAAADFALTFSSPSICVDERGGLKVQGGGGTQLGPKSVSLPSLPLALGAVAKEAFRDGPTPYAFWC